MSTLERIVFVNPFLMLGTWVLFGVIMAVEPSAGATVNDAARIAISVIGIIIPFGILAAWLGWPTCVAIYLKNRDGILTDSETVKAKRALFLLSLVVVVILVAYSAMEDSNFDGKKHILQVMSVVYVLVLFYCFYVVVSVAAKALVYSEVGKPAPLGKVLFVSYLILNLPFGIFFLSRRLRRLGAIAPAIANGVSK